MGVSYRVNIAENPSFTLRKVSPLFRWGFEDGKERYASLIFDGLMHVLSFDPSAMVLTIRWNQDGRKNEQRIKIRQERSNLPTLSESRVLYFICPVTGAKCRKLYKLGSVCFVGRKALRGALYPIQMASRYTRETTQKNEPYKKYGKPHYKDKLTPYGRRCLAYEDWQERMEAACFARFLRYMKRYGK